MLGLMYNSVCNEFSFTIISISRSSVNIPVGKFYMSVLANSFMVAIIWAGHVLAAIACTRRQTSFGTRVHLASMQITLFKAICKQGSEKPPRGTRDQRMFD